MWLAASSFAVPDGVLATLTTAQLNGKPHQGVLAKNLASPPGIGECNSTAAIGLQASLALNGLRQSERARYYGSALGRWTSPDWSSAQQPVPYANLANPQTLNLYAYVSNNPLSRTDPDGHNWWDKLKNLFGWAGCWCEGEQAESAALRNLYAEQRRQQQEVDQWRANMRSPGYHVAMAMVYATAGAGGEEIGAEAEAAAAEEEGALSGANYAQRTFSRNFSSGGTFAGRSVEEIATELRSGQLNTADVPVEYIVRDGNKLILNTRSAQALEQAGIPRSQWVSVNVTGDAAAEARLTGQLQRNGLTSQGVSTVTPNQE